MTLFTLFLIPETKGVPIEEMTERVWKKHWFWKRYMMKSKIIPRPRQMLKPSYGILAMHF
ncbi:hypothetical protein Prudu_001310 [Prunus dulcis]|uniref:Uncharacterized protein n=1 Tax=Prunus dulcis TaxID=3755 RepID=A0A4Y1QN91_PRUDU|nr:hypothetical protein Prudu_001310 [Prunus dulcis]